MTRKEIQNIVRSGWAERDRKRKERAEKHKQACLDWIEFKKPGLDFLKGKKIKKLD